jgi:hypothetical protein
LHKMILDHFFPLPPQPQSQFLALVGITWRVKLNRSSRKDLDLD